MGPPFFERDSFFCNFSLGFEERQSKVDLALYFRILSITCLVSVTLLCLPSDVRTLVVVRSPPFNNLVLLKVIWYFPYGYIPGILFYLSNSKFIKGAWIHLVP